MKCSKCNVEISDDAKFCPVCGAKVEPESKCPNCGEKLEDGAKFCTKCGTKIDNCNEGKENLSSTSENLVTEATKSTIVKHDEESSAINASRSLPATNSSSMAVKKNKSAKKAIIIIIAFVFVAVIIVWSVGILVQHFVNKSNYQDNSYNYGYSSNSNLSNTYSNEYISFRYPSNYKITDVEKDENGEISFNCEIKGDNLSCITIASGEDASLAYSYEQEIKEMSIETINTINSTLTMYYDIKFSTISKKTVGNCKGYFCDFTAKAFSETFKGYTFVGVSVNYYVTIVAQAENDKYMRQLDEILSTLDVKAEALEGEWSTIR